MLARIKREEDRDQSAHDVRVAVADERQCRTGGTIGLDSGGKPYLAGAALHLVRLAAQFLRQRLEGAAELDNVAIAVVPLVEQGEILDDVVDRGHGLA